jgi:hypothetical protein
MIQRIQTLFLLAAAVISIFLFFTSFSEKSIPESDGSVTRYVLKLTNVTRVPAEKISLTGGYYNILMPVINIAGMLVTLIAIFTYKKRALQIKLCMFGILLFIIMIVVVFSASENMGLPEIPPHYLEGIYLIAAQIIFLLAAHKFIRKDELLIRSANRIR